MTDSDSTGKETGTVSGHSEEDTEMVSRLGTERNPECKCLSK
jgi:hypothetical protein